MKITQAVGFVLFIGSLHVSEPSIMVDVAWGIGCLLIGIGAERG